MRGVAGLCLLASGFASAQPAYVDGHHHSNVFGENRMYRIFLPRDYATSEKRYPVLYYFHGHSDRYTLEDYDKGLDTVPKIAAFVANHDVIVVAADGYVARDYTGFYGGAPYDVRRNGGDYDYGEYFLELVRHIDSAYRTLTTRRYRATSGLSMGGFMSLYLSARYPDLIGSASAFNPGPEFFAGEKGRRSLWRPKDHVLNHQHSMIRLIRASGDFISQYTEETRTAYARSPVDFEFRQDEYHRHWATSIGETFEFHWRAFANPALDTVPVEWNYTSAQREFDVHGWHAKADLAESALIDLEHITQGGLGIRTRRWTPDGPAASCTAIHISTAPLYHEGAAYRLIDHSLSTGKTKNSELRAGADGKLSFDVDCSGHEVSFAGPGTGSQLPLLLTQSRGVLRVRPDRTIELPVSIYNPRDTAQTVRLELTSEYPTVKILNGAAEWKPVPPGAAARPPAPLQVQFTAGGGEWEHARLDFKITYDDWHEAKQTLDVLVAPDHLSEPAEVVVLDGMTKTFPVFRQTGNQGGGARITRTVTEGTGNGNGILERGEQATIWIRLPQGLDPFDKDNWCRAKVYSESPLLTEVADIQEEKQREWTGAQNRTSLVALASDVPRGAKVPVILDCESYSFRFTPNVRYGRELLYQAFQFHKHHVFSWTVGPGPAHSTAGKIHLKADTNDHESH